MNRPGFRWGRAANLATRASAVIGALTVAATLTGCGSSASGLTVPKVAPARTFSISGLTLSPSGPIHPGHPVTLTFHITQPNGKPLTSFRTGPGPHTGVHLIIVRHDLAYIIHQHPPIRPDGLLKQTVTFPAAGPYRMLVDVYPKLPGVLPNFQLFRTLTVQGKYQPKPLPPYQPKLVVDGYHFHMLPHPQVHAIQAQFLHVNITTPAGRPATFTPWFGALAHAIFFRKGSLDYFHTHICAPNAPNCGTLPGVRATAIRGSSAAPGKITIGVLLALPGTWRLFLQMKFHGRIVTAPFTLKVAS
jgi:hypothetical protein